MCSKCQKANFWHFVWMKNSDMTGHSFCCSSKAVCEYANANSLYLMILCVISSGAPDIIATKPDPSMLFG